jgi:hypothetical protein
MPKTTMHEYDLPMARQDDVGRARKIFPMQPKSIAHGMQGAAHAHFWRRVFSLDG